MLPRVLVRRELPGDVDAVRAVVVAAFAATEHGTAEPVEAPLLDRLRACPAWLPPLSVVAEVDGTVVGHVVCTRAHVGERAALGLGPLAVAPDRQREGVGTALMHAVLGAADAMDEPVVVLLGHTDFYPRFGFGPAVELGIDPPVPEWGAHFQARRLTAYEPGLRGRFRYAEPFDDL